MILPPTTDIEPRGPLYNVRAPTMTDKHSSFTRYKQGYEDGYEGFILARPDSNDYKLGYEVGKEDDQLGLPNRFEPDHNES